MAFQRCGVLLLIGAPVISQAEIVLWTAQGTVKSVVGSFEGSGIAADEALDFRMSYDDQADFTKTKDTFGQQIEGDYRGNINLTISVKVGDFLWIGQTDSGAELAPATLFTRQNNFVSPEVLEATLDGVDGSTFSAFPFAVEAANPRISVKFTGPNTFIGLGIESREIMPSVITSATGFLRSGSTDNQLQFEIDPATVSVIDLVDEPFAPTLSVRSPGEDFELTWVTDPRFDYRLEQSSSLEAEIWTVVETIQGTGGKAIRSFPRGEISEFYRVVAFSKPR